MKTCISDTPDGYIVSVYLEDGNGYGKWHPLRNFGDRQSDAKEFANWDVPKLEEIHINALIKQYKNNVKYIRVNGRNFKKTKIKKRGNKMTAEDFLKQRYEVCKGREQKWQLDDMYKFAKEAVMFARCEECKKAIKAYCIASGCEDANECHATYCREMTKFKELLNTEK